MALDYAGNLRIFLLILRVTIVPIMNAIELLLKTVLNGKVDISITIESKHKNSVFNVNSLNFH